METPKWGGGPNNLIKGQQGEGRKWREEMEKFKNGRPNSKYIHNFMKCKCINTPKKKQLPKWV